MDETTKVIVGTISGFIVAFLVEPVKLFFQNKSRKKYFQLALYSEIYNNYRFLSSFLIVYHENNPHQLKAFFDGAIKNSIRLDCYSQFVSKFPDVYYQLKESSIINMLYAYLTSAANPVLYAEKDISAFHLAIESFVRLVEEHVARNELENDVLEKVVGKEEVKRIISEFKKLYKDK